MISVVNFSLNLGGVDVVETAVISSKDTFTVDWAASAAQCYLREEPRTKSSRQCLGLEELWPLVYPAGSV